VQGAHGLKQGSVLCAVRLRRGRRWVRFPGAWEGAVLGAADGALGRQGSIDKVGADCLGSAERRLGGRAMTARFLDEERPRLGAEAVSHSLRRRQGGHPVA